MSDQVVTWRANTRAGYHFSQHGNLFNQTFEFEEIPGLKFNAKLRVNPNYDEGPIFEIKLLVAKANVCNDSILAVCVDSLEKLKESVRIKVEYSSVKNSVLYEGAISFTPSIESMKEGFIGYGNNSDERVSFMEVVGHYWSNVIPATTITYIMKFDFELQNQNIKPSSLSKRFSEKLYLNEELSDVKIICEDKVFDCHKLILSQSDVFKSMLIESKMLEQSSREVKITDFPATAIESLIYYFYHDDFPEAKITINLLLAAHKYNVSELISICLNYLKANLNEQNAVEVMTKSYLINKDLFYAARKCVQGCQNNGKTVDIEALEELKKINPTLAWEIVCHAFFYGQK